MVKKRSVGVRERESRLRLEETSWRRPQGFSRRKRTGTFDHASSPPPNSRSIPSVRVLSFASRPRQIRARPLARPRVKMQGRKERPRGRKERTRAFLPRCTRNEKVEEGRAKETRRLLHPLRTSTHPPPRAVAPARFKRNSPRRGTLTITSIRKRTCEHVPGSANWVAEEAKESGGCWRRRGGRE